jgi:hypothetical protein
MASGYNVEVKGLKELERWAKRYPDLYKRHTGRAMESSVKHVEREVKPLVPVFHGRLRNSIASEVQEQGSKIIGIVGSTLKDEEYPAVMEFGRRAGAKMPPPSALERWVHLVLQVPVDKAPGVAFVVARSIGKKGIKGKRFLEQGFKAAVPRIQDEFAKALHSIVSAVKNGG